MMRLDKFLSVTATASRKESAALLKKGRVKVNGQPVFKGEAKIDEEMDTVTLDGEPILYQKHRNFLLKLKKLQLDVKIILYKIQGETL